MQSWRQCALPVIAAMAFHAPGHILYGYKSLVPMNQRVLKAIVLPQSHCGDSWEGTFSLWLHLYIYIYIYMCVCVCVCVCARV